MGDLTTPDRVRRRLGYVDPTLSDQTIQEYIDDSQAYIERVTRTSFTPTDSRYELARSVCTDLAAWYSVVRPAGGITEGLDYSVDEVKVSKSKQLQARLQTASQYRLSAREGLAALTEDETTVPISNTQNFG